ncbi:IS21 family transposase (plasmid) [Alkalihalophilus sp. As8PL]|uniref:IS21 family transposase n=1 Tax=Alkalihalophilus sp. As8PL TaxID=3237103 RepID=A0AB39BN00_9BACI
MVSYREILRLHAKGFSNRSIAASCSCSRNTVASVLKEAEKLGVSWPLENKVGDLEIQQILFPGKGKNEMRKRPDVQYIHKEMAKSGVTLSLLWHEYELICRENQEIPYSYRQFCRFYERYVHTSKATMRIKRKPGEALEVDWAGQTAKLKDSVTGELRKAYIFVAVLPCSQYSYVEAFESMDINSWIMAHIHAFEFFGGVPRTVVPDNLKTGVIKPKSVDPELNRTYQEMAEYYQTAIIPARVRHPKDKASVESTVNGISTWIIASLRNQEFFTVSELNREIQQKLREYNEKSFQKKKGSRLTAFLEEEKFSLFSLPTSRYEIASWQKATVPYDYHLNVQEMFYSVPYEYIKHRVEIRVTQTVIEVFYQSFRIASHKRLFGKEGQVSSLPEHMPEDHQNYINWNSHYYRNWAESMGEEVVGIIEGFFALYKTEKQALKSCMALMKLSDKYTPQRLTEACKKALTYSPTPNIQSIKTILMTGQDKVKITIESVTPKHKNEHGFTRGAAYYGRKK